MRQFIIPYVLFEDSQEAVSLYKEVFGGEVRYTMLGKDMPNCPEDQLDKVMHMEYVVEDNLIYMADNTIHDEGRINLHLNYAAEDKDKMTKAFNKLKAKGTVIQELKEEFWGSIFGVIKDPFDVTWQFHCRTNKD